MDRASASRGADSAFGTAAISWSMAAFRWCHVPTCVDARREETLCARGGDSPNLGEGIRVRVGSERSILRGQGTTGARAPPPARVYAPVSSTRRPRRPPPRQRGAPTLGRRDDCSAAPLSLWPAIPGWGSANACIFFVGKSVGRQGQKVAGRGQGGF